MKRNILRVSAATAMAAVAFGIAEPAASAVEHHRTENLVAAAEAGVEFGAAEARTLLNVPEFRAELAPEAEAALHAVADGSATHEERIAARASAISTFWNLLKKAGPSVVKAAKKAAGKFATFRNWVNGLSWYNPIKLAWQAAGAETQYQIWKYVHDHI
ncbi:hypothetical protein [Streptomyces venezuelae]|uniref:hypothetical protein n=1 Tax=Streptomyces venezuelae TaxID=54571 RepID=UPI003431CFFB